MIFSNMRLIIENSEKEDILSKYSDNTSDKLLVYLRRNFPVTSYPIERYDKMSDSYKIVNIPFIIIDEKNFFVESNKKNLVNKIYIEIGDQFLDVSEEVKRRTIKKYLDMINLTDF